MKISEEKKDLVLRLYMADVTQKDIAAFTNISLRSVSTIIKNAANKEPLRKSIHIIQNQMKELQAKVELLQEQINKLLIPQMHISRKSIDNDILIKNQLHDSSKKELLNIATSNKNI